jgi:hypothetical protein
MEIDGWKGSNSGRPKGQPLRGIQDRSSKSIGDSIPHRPPQWFDVPPKYRRRVASSGRRPWPTFSPALEQTHPQSLCRKLSGDRNARGPGANDAEVRLDHLIVWKSTSIKDHASPHRQNIDDVPSTSKRWIAQLFGCGSRRETRYLLFPWIVVRCSYF